MNIHIMQCSACFASYSYDRDFYYYMTLFKFERYFLPLGEQKLFNGLFSVPLWFGIH